MFQRKLVDLNNCFLYEHSEQARAPHTNGPRDVPRCGALSLLLTKAATLQGVFSRNIDQLLFIWALAQLLLAPAFNSRGT
jgi:hypothetical protein